MTAETDRNAVERFLKETGITWPNAYGAIETLSALGVTSIPRVFVIGRDGRVAWSDRLGGSLIQAIENALAIDEGRP